MLTQIATDAKSNEVTAKLLELLLLKGTARIIKKQPDVGQATMTKPLIEAHHGRIETRTATVSTDIE